MWLPVPFTLMNDIKAMKKALKKRHAERTDVPTGFLGCGSTVVNLACTNTPDGTFKKGKFHLVVGDSASGKTFLLLTTLAEAAQRKDFKEFRFIYDDVEGGALMNIKKFFGESLAARLEAPAYEDGERLHSTTIEEFFFHVDDAVCAGKPFIYILDSMDSLSSEAEQDKFQKTKKAHRSGKAATGSFGDGKAKKNSSGVRQLLTPIEKMGSIVIVVCQTRDNIGSIFGGKTRSGGKAPRFYACLEIWLSIKEDIKRTIAGKLRPIGTLSRVQIKKNRITGGLHNVFVPIYRKYGIDDVGSCVDFLVNEKHWSVKGKGLITAKEFKVKKSRDLLIRHIEGKGLEKNLQKIVASVWAEIEAGCELKNRKKRYL